MMASMIVEEKWIECIVRQMFVLSVTLITVDTQLIYRDTIDVKSSRRKTVYGAKVLAKLYKRSLTMLVYGFVLNFFLYYLMFKCFIICLIQLFRHRINHINVRYILDGNNLTSPQPPVSFVDQLSHLIGNPMSQLAGVSVFLYSSICFALFSVYFWIPYSHKKIPFEFNHVNLLLDCEREVKRIDLIIEIKLNQIFKQVDCFSSAMFNFSTKCQDHHLSNYHCGTYLNGNGSMNDLKLILKQIKLGAHSIRPAIYQAENHLRHASWIMTVIIILICVFIVPASLIVPPMLLEGAIESNCLKYMIINNLDVNNYKDDCNYEQVFVWQDILFCVELMIAMLVICWNFMSIVMEILDAIYTQIISARDIENDLDQCIRELSLIRVSQNLLKYKKDGRISFEKMIVEPSERAQYSYSLSYKLLKTLIKFNIVDEDGKSNANLISRLVTIYLNTIGLCLILSLIGGTIENREPGYDVKIVRNYVIFWLLAQANLLIVSCAHLQAEEMKLTKLIFSVTSRLLIGGNFESRNAIDSYIVSSWTKLAQGRSSYDTINTIQFLNMVRIDYKKLLELDFVFVSVAALLKSL